MFDIKKYLDKIRCPSCNDDSYKILSYSDYSKIHSLEDILKVYKSSSDDMLIDQLVECNTCKFSYLNPRINSDIIFSSYETNIDNKHLEQDKWRIKTFKKSMKKILHLIDIKEIRNLSFLDIGSASGAFLKSIKDIGFNEEGYEPSKWMVNFGKKNYNVNINQGSIDTVKKQKKFDFISFWDVLEHVTDLDQTLLKVKELSKKNTILIINVPDIDSISCKLMKKNWPFYLNVHLYYFNKKSLQNILNKYDFSYINSFPHFQYLELGYILYRAKKIFPPVYLIEKIIKLIGIKHFPVPYNLGQTTFIFKKND